MANMDKNCLYRLAQENNLTKENAFSLHFNAMLTV